MRIALVDDEQIYLDEMARICREFAEENRIDIEIYEFSDGDGFLSSEEDFSVVFIDIYMDGSNGVQTALRCRMTMKQFLGQTNDNERLILINKGIIVNADYITDFENNCCIPENGARLSIRVRDRLGIEQAARDYNFDKIRKTQRYGG